MLALLRQSHGRAQPVHGKVAQLLRRCRVRPADAIPLSEFWPAGTAGVGSFSRPPVAYAEQLLKPAFVRRVAQRDEVAHVAVREKDLAMYQARALVPERLPRCLPVFSGGNARRRHGPDPCHHAAEPCLLCVCGRPRDLWGRTAIRPGVLTIGIPPSSISRRPSACPRRAFTPEESVGRRQRNRPLSRTLRIRTFYALPSRSRATSLGRKP
jgi:hypothetical protein